MLMSIMPHPVQWKTVLNVLQNIGILLNSQNLLIRLLLRVYKYPHIQRIKKKNRLNVRETRIF